MATAEQTPEEKKESSNEIFKRLAEKRVATAMKSLRLVRQLTRYAHTKEQADKIVNALKKGVGAVEQAFEDAHDQEFKL